MAGPPCFEVGDQVLERRDSSAWLQSFPFRNCTGHLTVNEMMGKDAVAIFDMGGMGMGMIGALDRSIFQVRLQYDEQTQLVHESSSSFYSSFCSFFPSSGDG